MTQQRGHAPNGRPSSTAAALVVSELFPPTIGGSAELLFNIYRRFGDVPVTVLTEPTVAAAPNEPSMSIIRQPMVAPYWGLMRPAALNHHLGAANRIRR